MKLEREISPAMIRSPEGWYEQTVVLFRKLAANGCSYTVLGFQVLISLAPQDSPIHATPTHTSSIPFPF